MIYAALFGVGKIILQQPAIGAGLLVVSFVCTALLYLDIRAGWAGSS